MNKLPRHVAIIMDGNGRWAKAHKLSVALGHRTGVETLREIIRYSSNIGIEYLSLYAFSTENWKRSDEEVSALMQLMLEFFTSEIDELNAENVRIRILGDKNTLPLKQKNALIEAENITKDNRGLNLNIAINYGSRNELVKACKEIAGLVLEGKISVDEITEESISKCLYTANQPDVDLLIRTSGEMRISNFLLYQCAYAEMMFPTVLWPDYSVALYKADIEAYASRNRRFGGR